MDFGSDFTYLAAREEDEQIEVPAVLPAHPTARASSGAPRRVGFMDSLRGAVGGGAAPASAPAQQQTSARRWRQANLNIVSANLGTLGDSAELATGDPVVCGAGACGAVFSKLSKRSADGVWACEFCGHRNEVALEEEELPQAEVLDYVVAPAAQGSAGGSAGAGGSAANVVFCLDISGSMCVTTEVAGRRVLKGGGVPSEVQAFNTDRSVQYLPGESRNVTYVSRLQCCQQGVASQLEHLAANRPQDGVAIVTFNSEVTVVGETEDQILAGARLTDRAFLQQTGESVALTRTAAELRKPLLAKLWALQEGGATALGPALVVATAIAAQRAQSRVLVCTDGLANVGLGALDGPASGEAVEAAREFYESVAQQANSRGVSVSVLAIKGSGSVGMEMLGALADATQGKVDLVDPAEIESHFQGLLDDAVVATEVSVTMLVHRGLSVATEEEVAERLAEQAAGRARAASGGAGAGAGAGTGAGTGAGPSRVTKRVGTATAGTEVAFEYSVRSASELQALVAGAGRELPFQLQVRYTKPDGMKGLRVLTRTHRITTDRAEAEAAANVDVVGVHGLRQAAVMARRGDYEGARMHSAANQRVLARAMQSPVAAQKAGTGAYAAVSRAQEQLSANLYQAQMSEAAEGLALDDSDGDDDSSEGGQRGEKSGGPVLKRARKEAVRSARRSDDTATSLWQMKNVGKSAFK